MESPRYTEDWFSKRIPLWENYITPSFKDSQVHCVEVGSYEGRSARWLCEQVLTHPKSRLYCIDLWPVYEIQERFHKNLKEWIDSKMVYSLHGDWRQMIPHLISLHNNSTGLFDLCYLDADHQAKSVISQLAMLWPFVKIGGIVVVDDYKLPPQKPKRLPVAQGVDAFIELWNGDYELILKDLQVIFKKIS